MANGSSTQTGTTNGCWIPQSGEDVEAVRAQLERVLSAPQFSVSRRYPSLLRHVVERAIEGRVDGLKERSLGVDVFGREPGYDTNEDPVVRMTAGQVRRRLVEYYQEAGREQEIRIELPLGAYVPVFRLPAEAVTAPPPEIAAPAPPLGPLKSSRRTVVLVAGVALLATAAAFIVLVISRQPTALESFWGPVWGGSHSVSICVARGLPLEISGDPPFPATAREVMRLNRVAWADALTFSRLSSFLVANGNRYVAHRADETTFAQMREGPAILIGGYNNQWIMRLTGQLRFSFQRDLERKINYIQDRQAPSNRRWSVDSLGPLSAFNEDFGIIMRYFDPITQQYVVVASGIAYYGTMASGEFLTDPRLMEILAARAPRDWGKMNLQAVFSTKIIDGETGQPQILATHFW